MLLRRTLPPPPAEPAPPPPPAPPLWQKLREMADSMEEADGEQS